MRMKIATLTVALVASAALAAAQAPGGQGRGGGRGGPQGPGLTLTSPAFEDGGIIPDRFTQAVDNAVSPQLQWTNVPDGVESFTLLMHDPDVALQRSLNDVTHWLIFNIPGSARGLPEGVAMGARLPDGSQQLAGRGGAGYRGPGAGAAGPYHHYTLELFALDTTLDLPEDTTREAVMAAIDGHIVAKAVLVGRFHR